MELVEWEDSNMRETDDLLNILLLEAEGETPEEEAPAEEEPVVPKAEEEPTPPPARLFLSIECLLKKKKIRLEILKILSPFILVCIKILKKKQKKNT